MVVIAVGKERTWTPVPQLPHLVGPRLASRLLLHLVRSLAVLCSVPAKTTPWVRKYPSSETHRRPVGYNHLWHGPGPRSATQRTWSGLAEKESTDSIRDLTSHRSWPCIPQDGIVAGLPSCLLWLWALVPCSALSGIPPPMGMDAATSILVESSCNLRHLQTCHGISGLEYLH